MTRLLSAILVACVAITSRGNAQTAGSSLAVIVGRDAGTDSLSLGDVRRIFLGDRQFLSGRTKISLLVPPPGAPERATALRVVYRMGEAEYRQYWIAKIFRAEVTSGPQIATAEQAKRLVATTPGAIALIPASAIDGTVRVVRVNGRAPGQSGYELR